jgi:exosortase/archaeosortase family protein
MSDEAAMNIQAIGEKGRIALQKSIKTPHRRVICCGLLVGLAYFPVWLSSLISNALNEGTSDLFLVPGMAYLGFQGVWQQRQILDQQTASPEDRFLGYLLIFAAVLAFPFCRFDTWSQAVVWVLALAGIACSTWGLGFLKDYPLQCGLIIIGTYPNFVFVAEEFGRVALAHNALENWMAQAGGTALVWLGHHATVKENYIFLANGGVEVKSACNGLDMAVTVAAFGFLMSLFMKQPMARTIAIGIMGLLLGLLFNVPRIMVMTFASVYWGKASFEFWHGSIGGQIFSTILLTVFYYIAMALMKPPKQPSTTTK